MAVRISRALLAQIVAHAAREPGNEVCGLLTGGGDRIDDAIETMNVAAERANRFEIDPATLFAAIRAERAGGPAVVGHYHSHPGGRAEPSARDAADAEGARLWMVIGDAGAALWRSGAADGLHGCFQPVELIEDDGSTVA